MSLLAVLVVRPIYGCSEPGMPLSSDSASVESCSPPFRSRRLATVLKLADAPRDVLVSRHLSFSGARPSPGIRRDANGNAAPASMPGEEGRLLRETGTVSDACRRSSPAAPGRRGRTAQGTGRRVCCPLQTRGPPSAQTAGQRVRRVRSPGPTEAIAPQLFRGGLGSRFRCSSSSRTVDEPTPYFGTFRPASQQIAFITTLRYSSCCQLR